MTLTSRIVLLDATGKVSQTRIITAIQGGPDPGTWQVFWGGTKANTTPPGTDPLPPAFTPAQARVETLEQRYTWMLTVRRSTNGQANVDVTVFFRRPVVANSPDEQLYLGSGQGSQFTIQYGGFPKPFLKKGGFLSTARSRIGIGFSTSRTIPGLA